MRHFEQLLVGLDSGVSGAIGRIALGLAILPAFRGLTGNSGQIWLYAILFLAVLLALRLAPALMRFVLPLSHEAKAIWSERRQIAKQYDSYQWQKLFWIGLGLLLFSLLGSEHRINEIVLTVFCLVGGGAGLFLWRKSRAISAQTYQGV